MRSISSIKFLFAPLVMIALIISALPLSDCQAQPPQFKKPNFGKAPIFGKKPFSSSAAPAAFSATAGFKTSADRKTGVLEVRCNIPAGSHLFSVTQQRAVPGPLKTRIRVDDSSDFKLTGKFQPDKDPHLKPIPGQVVKSEEHEGKVVFSAPLRFTDAAAIDALTINVQLNGQVCTDAGSCIQIQEKLVARSEGVLAVIPAGAKFSPDSQHLLLSGVAAKVVNGAISDTPVQPGDKISIELTAEPQDKFHVYAHSTDLTKTGSATFLAITKTGGWSFSGPNTTDLPKVDSSTDSILKYYETPVTWKYETVIPRGFEGQSNTISGIMGVQTCTHQNCDRPVSVGWKVEIPIGKTLSGTAINFQDAGNIKAAIEAVEAEEKLRGSGLETSGASVQSDAGDWAGSSLASVLPLAFLAGFILNFMPCVLPVIGLKVMSFVHQAGQNPGRIFMLNAMFCLGMISVFMILAFFAVQSGLGWGQQFEGLTFKIIMIAVVVVFGLSFFGVWEIPLPGFGSGGLDQKEGLTGAFLKGILTTLLATPCSGPMLIPAIVWAIAQPASVTYLVFLALGLGMGAPYLVIGVYPKLVSKLPKPGPWMETFKRIMGFIMLGTAVFLIGAVEQKFVVPVLSMLLILAFACWWMGRTSMAAPLPERMKSWAISAAIGAFAVWFSFFFLIPQYELDYQPYTRIALEEHLEEGRKVFVDFTADW